MDRLFGVVGFLPWRCGGCERRFHARLNPFRYLLYAHCGICGNLDLQRISPARVEGVVSIAARALKLNALRCDPCRNKFFSLRPPLRPASADLASLAD